jgi:hypothetical protein
MLNVSKGAVEGTRQKAAVRSRWPVVPIVVPISAKLSRPKRTIWLYRPLPAPLVVVQAVAGSSPVAHPQRKPRLSGVLFEGLIGRLLRGLNMASIPRPNCPAPGKGTDLDGLEIVVQ